MTPEEYIHDRDLYYVVHSLHVQSLELEPPYKTNLYHLKDHRTFAAPTIREQRTILHFLNERGIIIIEDYLGRSGKSVALSNAATIKFRRDETNALSEYFWRLLYKLEEANLNHISFHESERIWLTIQQNVIRVHLPLLVLRINPSDLKSNSFPESFFVFLIEKGNGKLYDKTTFPHRTSRSYSDVVTKAGFNNLLRKIFVPVLDSSHVQILPSADASLRDITDLTKLLILLPENQNVYQKYMEDIDKE